MLKEPHSLSQGNFPTGTRHLDLPNLATDCPPRALITLTSIVLLITWFVILYLNYLTFADSIALHCHWSCWMGIRLVPWRNLRASWTRLSLFSTLRVRDPHLMIRGHVVAELRCYDGWYSGYWMVSVSTSLLEWYLNTSGLILTDIGLALAD